MIVKNRLTPTALIAALSMGCLTSPFIQSQELSYEALYQLIQEQQKQLEKQQEQIDRLTGSIRETKLITESTADALEQQIDKPSTGNWTDKTTLGGYGEHHFNARSGRSDEVDAHRYVLYVGHEFNDSVRFFSEVELEHSLAGEGQPGEVELEQAYIDWRFSDNHHLIIGQFLLPIGILNETHEPDTFYGVERNGVESRVIPATWWETGLMLQGELSEGLNYNLAFHSGLRTAQLNDAGTSRNLRIRSGRQKSAQAVADDFATSARLKYTAIPGLELSASLQYQHDITQSQLTDSASALLFETHAIYQHQDFSLRALYASWDIDNDFFAAANTDELTGWFIEPSYKLTEALGLFLRWSDFDRADGSVDIANPINDQPSENRFFDIGINYWLTNQVVLKADYQDDQLGDANSFNLGVGWSF